MPAAFTISNSQTVQQLTNYLLNNNLDRANDWIGEDVTFHIDVRATSGDTAEPFVFTNKQLDQAKKWHESGSDVHIIARVCGLPGKPRLSMYVEPLKLVLQGGLEISAVGGYYLKPT